MEILWGRYYYYHLIFTDKETGAESLRDLPKVTAHKWQNRVGNTGSLTSNPHLPNIVFTQKILYITDLGREKELA